MQHHGYRIPEEEAKAARDSGIEPYNVGLAVLSLIRSYGVDTVFGIPGTHNLEFYRHLERLGFHSVTTRHEQGASFAADGWFQRTGKPGVVITTSGPGLLNALSAVGNAFCESRPQIVLTPGPARGEEFADVGTMHETKDQVRAADSIAAWARRVETAQDAINAVHDAFELFATTRPRPVVIEIPIDLLEGPSDADPETLEPRSFGPAARAEPARIDEAVALLGDASKPVIIVGGGALAAGAELTQLAERLGAAAISTMNGKGIVSESHALSLGADLRLKSMQDTINASDVLLIVGAKLSEPGLWGAKISPKGKIIRIDILASQQNKNISPDLMLVGNAQAVTAQLLASLESVNTPTEVWDIEGIRKQLARDAEAFAPVSFRLARRIANVLPEDVIVSGDSSQISYAGMASVIRANEPGIFLYTPTYATLGYGMPAALGAKLAEPTRTVVSVVGDGALMFSLQELQTVVEQKLDLTVICVDNGGYAEIRQNEIDRGIKPVGVELSQPDWAALADAFGGKGFSVKENSELEAMVKEAVATKGLTLVHVPLNLFTCDCPGGV